MLPRIFLVALISVLVGCVTESESTSLHALAADEAEAHAEADPGHARDEQPVIPAPVTRCLNCHRPANPGYPPKLPPRCTRCHFITPPTDPHFPDYPSGTGRPARPDDADYCRDCHKPPPVIWTTSSSLELVR
jgi:hypothetical protein